jgi:hypothetical protein
MSDIIPTNEWAEEPEDEAEPVRGRAWVFWLAPPIGVVLFFAIVVGAALF